MAGEGKLSVQSPDDFTGLFLALQSLQNPAAVGFSAGQRLTFH